MRDAHQVQQLRQDLSHDYMLRGVLLQVGYVVAFCGLAFWHFQRKDVNS